MKARIIIGANYGDEGKGTVTAHYTKHAKGKVLNILTNGGSQRGHSILTEDGSMTFQHFGSGTYYGADNYYSSFFILNPMQFVREYISLIVKPQHIYRNINCLWTTPYDSIANHISEEHRHASCCMGIWNTIRRSKSIKLSFDTFIKANSVYKEMYLQTIKRFYEREMFIPDDWKDIWESKYLISHFINDCIFMYRHTEVSGLTRTNYDELIFENGQGLLLGDTGKDEYDKTPSHTGAEDALCMLTKDDDIILHYVTRPYLTRHGDGFFIEDNVGVTEDRTNHYNEGQGEFKFGKLDINDLKDRIINDSKGFKFEIELTHCDEVDRVSSFKKVFDKVNIYDSALIK